MSKYTLLDMTQMILSRMDSDEVNSIGDTTESRQVAEVIRAAYNNIIARSDLPEHKKLIQLTSSLDATKPVMMLKPSNVVKLEWVKYDVSENTSPDYNYVTLVPLEQFLDTIHRFDPDADNVSIFDFNDFAFYYQTDIRPKFCTVLEDQYVIFDAFNSAIENTLQETKTLCSALVRPIFNMTDSFVPEIDESQFPLLVNEAVALAFFELKQTVHEPAVRESRRQWVSIQRTKDLVKPNPLDAFANFARRR